MADTIEQHLTQGETIIHRAFLRKSALIIPIFFGGLFLLGSLPAMGSADSRGVGFVMFLLGAAILFYAYMLYKSTYFIVTNKRIMVKKGVFSVHSIELLHSKVESITYKGIGDAGTIIIAGTGGSKEVVTGISQPKKFKDAAQQAIENHHVASTGQAGSGGGKSSADELAKLADLMAKGVLSREEFEEQKKKLLAI